MTEFDIAAEINALAAEGKCEAVRMPSTKGAEAMQYRLVEWYVARGGTMPQKPIDDTGGYWYSRQGKFLSFGSALLAAVRAEVDRIKGEA